MRPASNEILECRDRPACDCVFDALFDATSSGTATQADVDRWFGELRAAGATPQFMFGAYDLAARRGFRVPGQKS